jgi:DNA-binding MarR family transcriptional regulator
MSAFESPGDERPALGAVLETLQRIWALNHEVERLSARMRRSLGITAQQRMVLRIVGRFPGIRPVRLSSVLCLDAATLSTALSRLERAGLVTRERDERDGRRVYVALTARGRELDVPTTGTVEAAVEAALAKCEPSDVAGAYRVLDALRQSLIEQEAPPVEGSSKIPPGRRRTR